MESPVELRHLRYFVAVAERLHFARAAQALGIAPPTLTVQIQEIERSLQARLFSRSKRSVALTPAGEAFLAEARATLERFERALGVGRRAGRGEIGRIEIGYVGSAVFAGILQREVHRFRAARPGVLVRARELPMESLPAELADGGVDMAFVRLPVALPGSLRAHVLLRDRFCVALPVGHALADRAGAVRSRALAGETFVLPEQDLGTREVARRGRFEPRVGGAPGGLLAVLAQVSLGAGVAVVPGVLAEAVNLPGVVFRPLAGAPVVSEVAAVYRRQEHSPAVRQLVAQMLRAGP